MNLKCESQWAYTKATIEVEYMENDDIGTLIKQLDKAHTEMRETLQQIRGYNAEERQEERQEAASKTST